MDFSKFKTPDWLMIGGGAAMLILGFALDWTSVDTGFGSASGDGPFDYFITGGLAWLLIVAVGVLALLHGLGKLPESKPWPVILLGMAALGTLLMLLCLLLGARFDFADRGTGMYGAIAALRRHRRLGYAASVPGFLLVAPAPAGVRQPDQRSLRDPLVTRSQRGRFRCLPRKRQHLRQYRAGGREMLAQRHGELRHLRHHGSAVQRFCTNRLDNEAQSGDENHLLPPMGEDADPRL
jgi:hypothetical protein